MAEEAAAISRKLDAMRPARQIHEDVWKDCFDYTFPLRASGLQQEVLDAQSGQRRQSLMTDATATESSRTLGSGMMGGMTPANSLWFQMTVHQASDEEKRWFSTESHTLWENIHASNFDAVAFECLLDMIPGGWFVMYVDEDREQGGFHFEQWPLAQCYIATSKPGGAVDIIYREYRITAEQAVTDFGLESLSPEVQKLAKEKPGELVQFVHAIYPRKVYAVGALRSENLPFASCVVETKSKRLVRESGYHEFPCIVPRWAMLPESVYAVGPVFDALPDIKELNELKRMEKASLDLAVAGMWIAQDDGVLNPRTVKVGPRKIIIANSVESMKPLVPGIDFNIAFASEERLQASIRKMLMADQLQPQDGPAMTATEVQVRVDMIRQMLGPVYGRFQSEYLKPLVERCFAIAFRAGVFSPAPESLQGREFTVKFLSPLARSQKMEEVIAIDRHVAAAVQVQPFQPDVMDNIDLDAAIKFRGEALGIPAGVQRKDDDIKRIRAARAAQQQRAQQQAMMQPTVDEAGKAMAQKMVAA